MNIIFPTPAQAALQTPPYTFSPTSTPLANTYNGATYFFIVGSGVWSITPGSITAGTVTQIDTGAGLTGGPITTTGTVSIAPATNTSLGGVSPDGTVITITPSGDIDLSGTFRTSLIPDLNITHDLGSVTNRWRDLYLSNNTLYLGEYALSVINGVLEIDGIPAGTGVTEVIAGTGLTGGTITSTGTIALANTPVTAGSYTNASITVDATGRITAASSGTSGGGSVSSITAGTGLTGGTITTSGTVALANTAVSAGSYTNACLTVDAQGRLTAAASGPAPILCSTVTAKGDLIVGTNAGAVTNLPVGTNAQVLAACSTATNGVCWLTITQCQGTVTSVGAGTGLSGGAITTTGTISLNQATPNAIGGVLGIANASSTNVALGNSAGQALGGAVDNVAIGDFALSTGNGSCNIAIGAVALSKITGTRNVAIGIGALSNGVNATNNIGIGHQALFCLTTGLNNTEIGANNGISSFYSPPFQVTTECNRLVLGSTATTNAYVQVAWTVVSDERDKTEITALPVGLDFIAKLEPISYRYRESRESDVATGPTRYGFSAQQVLEVEGENSVVVDTEDLDKLKITDSSIIPILVQAIKELKAEVDSLKNQG